MSINNNNLLHKWKLIPAALLPSTYEFQYTTKNIAFFTYIIFFLKSSLMSVYD